MPLDISKIRHETPACENILHFNNAGASLMPQPVYLTMTDYLNLEQKIGGYEAASMQHKNIERFYTVFAELLNATPGEIAYVENATRAWDMAVYSIPFQAGDRIITHTSEYSSNYLALLQLQKEKNKD